VINEKRQKNGKIDKFSQQVNKSLANTGVTESGVVSAKKFV